MTKNILSILVFAAFSNSALSSPEPESTVEWRVLGPAFAWHGSAAGAPVVGYSKISGHGWVCTIDSNPYSTAWYVMTPEQAEILSPSSWECTVRDYVAKVPNRGWTNVNPAVGLERTTRYDDHADKVFGGLVRDSYGQPSAMVGAARMWPLYQGRMRVEVGVSGLLWYRTVGQWGDGSFDRKLVPLVLPVMAVNDKGSGLGVNVSFVPGIRYRGTEYSVPTLMLQSTYQF